MLRTIEKQERLSGLVVKSKKGRRRSDGSQMAGKGRDGRTFLFSRRWKDQLGR